MFNYKKKNKGNFKVWPRKIKVITSFSLLDTLKTYTTATNHKKTNILLFSIITFLFFLFTGLQYVSLCKINMLTLALQEMQSTVDNLNQTVSDLVLENNRMAEELRQKTATIEKLQAKNFSTSSNLTNFLIVTVVTLLIVASFSSYGYCVYGSKFFTLKFFLPNTVLFPFFQNDASLIKEVLEKKNYILELLAQLQNLKTSESANAALLSEKQNQILELLTQLQNIASEKVVPLQAMYDLLEAVRIITEQEYLMNEPAIAAVIVAERLEKIMSVFTS